MTKKRIIHILRIVMPLVALCCLIIFPPWVLVWAWIAPLPATVQQQLNDAAGHGLDGIIVYVDEAGKPPAFYAAGWKNRENKVPADPKALFKIASISKLYVAVAVTRLACNKRLSLDESLAQYFPELVGRIAFAEKITLRMMLQHRSGIPNLTDNPAFPWADPPKSSREALAYALDQPALFDPGTDYAYSNTNYLLLAEIIDQVVGYNHQQFIKEEILIPLGLKNTFASLHEVNPDDVMSGYFVGWQPDIKSNNHGSMIATAEDVGLFLRALNDGSLLSEAEQEMYSSVYVYEHTGLVPGYQSIAKYHKDIDTVIIQFVNTSGGDMWTLSEIVYKRIVKILKRRREA
ncbi:MAG: beta-lactamase family protein [Bacteroidales bacterium]|nr:beta-lactamase family protein [Bacteroidales bacterium]